MHTWRYYQYFSPKTTAKFYELEDFLNQGSQRPRLMQNQYTQPCQNQNQQFFRIAEHPLLLFFFFLVARSTKGNKGNYKTGSKFAESADFPRKLLGVQKRQGIENHCSDSTDKLWFQMAQEDLVFSKSQNEHG